MVQNPIYKNNLTNRQLAHKVQVTVWYGACTHKGSGIFDLLVAASVTMGGSGSSGAAASEATITFAEGLWGRDYSKLCFYKKCSEFIHPNFLLLFQSLNSR